MLAHRLVIMLLAAAVASFAVLPATASAQPPLPAPPPPVPANDPFYAPPAPLPDGEPGDVIRARPSTAYLDPLRTLPVPARTWQVLYRSTSATGEPNAVSGTVLVPRTAWRHGPRPIVSYAVGTHGLGDRCAPSYQMAAGTDPELNLVGQALARGWAVVVTDYEGLGTPGDHTYPVARSEGHAVLDAVRSAQRLPETTLRPDAPVGVWGYSQGGGAAAAAGEDQPDYAPELRLRGVAAGGVPADLLRVGEHLDGTAFSGFLPAVAIGFDAAYPDIGLDALLNDRGRRVFADVRDDCVAEFVTKYGGRRTAQYTTIPDPLHHPPLVARLAENDAGDSAPSVPVRLYHAQLDQLIPLPVGRELRADYCRLGIATQFEVLPGAEHVGGAVAGAPRSVTWLADRFAGRPAPSSC